jgi:hypothetical protein
MSAPGADTRRRRCPPAGRRPTVQLTKSGVTEDIITRDKFGDFELAFDWTISPGGNAGLFYRGTEEYDHIYWSAPEYQLLDDSGHVDGKNRLTSAGAAYGLYPSPGGSGQACGSVELDAACRSGRPRPSIG